jgi:PAS domain S-box-containing protein
MIIVLSDLQSRAQHRAEDSTRRLLLQQAELEGEIAARARVEEGIRELNRELESRVAERTAALSKANEELHEEVAERKRAEQALRESEERFRLLVDRVRDYAIVMLGRDGRVLSWNRGAERINGFTAPEILGKHFSTFYTPEDLADDKPARELQVAEANGAYEEENWRVRKDGSRFQASVLITAVRDETGTLRGFAKVVRDITERKQAEERFRLIVETAPNAMVMVNRSGTIVLVNAQTEVLFGYPRDELLGQPVELLVPDRFRDRHPAHRENYLATPQPRPMGIGRDLYGRRKDGREVPIEIGLTPIETAEGLLVLAMIVDITERKRAEEALRAKTEELRTMSQQLWQTAKLATMGELAASIAHELNNPLATINLHLESLLEDSSPDSPGTRRLAVINQEVERMGQLVANLLQFSRPGRQQISTLDVREELEKTVEIIHYLLRKGQIAVERDYAADLPMIQADRQKLRQVLLNLLMNASDAMPAGGTVTLRARPAVLPGQKRAVAVEVSDTGIGIDPENVPRVQEPFFTTKEEGKGTGLGLAICRRIVQEHHGTLELTSAVGRGTTVRVVLPVANGTNGTIANT